MTRSSASLIKATCRLFIFAVFFLFQSSFSFAQSVGDKTKSEEKTIKLTDDKVDSSRLYNVATLQGLNKITAVTSKIDAKIGEKTSFGQLTIIVRKCWQAPLEQKPESKILMEVFEDQNDASGNPLHKRIFYGWMFSSSPSVSSFDHPIYDITAINCKKSK